MNQSIITQNGKVDRFKTPNYQLFLAKKMELTQKSQLILDQIYQKRKKIDAEFVQHATRKARSDGLDAVITVLLWLLEHVEYSSAYVGFVAKDGVLRSPSVKVISKKLGFGIKRIRRALLYLLKRGYIQRERRTYRTKEGQFKSGTTLTKITFKLIHFLKLDKLFVRLKRWAQKRLRLPVLTTRTPLSHFLSLYVTRSREKYVPLCHRPWRENVTPKPPPPNVDQGQKPSKPVLTDEMVEKKRIATEKAYNAWQKNPSRSLSEYYRHFSKELGLPS